MSRPRIDDNFEEIERRKGPGRKRPLFSVVIATHNRSDLLLRALNSVLNQSHDSFEVIVVDDGSLDDTQDVVAKLQDPRLRYVFQENRGPSVARNNGASLALGSYVTFLDDDDEALPDWLKAFSSVIQQSDARIICCGVMLVRQDLSIAKVRLPEDLGPMCDQRRGLFLTGSFVVHRGVFAAVGGYASQCRSAENTELSWRLVPLSVRRGWSIQTIELPLIRQHRRVRGPHYATKKLNGVRYLLDEHRDALKMHPGIFARHLTIASINAARAGLFEEARHFLWNAIKVKPWRLSNYVRLIAVVSPMRSRLWRGTGEIRGT